MKGAQAILETLRLGGVDTIFANPGTSEMALVRALDEAPGVRAVLGLFEGVVTGAADGYARMAGRPAATCCISVPGLANGCANLHNARRARSAIVNVVGEHARDHIALDAPLTTDLEAIAAAVLDLGPPDYGVRIASVMMLRTRCSRRASSQGRQH